MRSTDVLLFRHLKLYNEFFPRTQVDRVVAFVYFACFVLLTFVTTSPNWAEGTEYRSPASSRTFCGAEEKNRAVSQQFSLHCTLVQGVRWCVVGRRGILLTHVYSLREFED